MKISQAEDRPFISVVIPCRDECRFIERCLDSLVASNYPKHRFEVLVIDGMSDDGTRAVLDEYARRYAFISVFDNPKRITPAALNIGILRAKGDYVFWVGAHSMCDKQFFTLSVDASEEYGADNIGGVMVTLPQDDSLMARSIVACISHPFGVGNSHFRTRPNEPKWVDTVFGGCYRRQVFQKIGLFNERLRRGQDLEFNRRLSKAGGRTLLVPEVVNYYYARSTFGSFWKHNWTNGVWAILPFLHSPIRPVSARHLVPLVFVTTILAMAVAALMSSTGKWLLLMATAPYVLVLLIASAAAARAQRDWLLLYTMPVTFASLHVAYGLGSLMGLLEIAWRFLKGDRRPTPKSAWPTMDPTSDREEPTAPGL